MRACIKSGLAVIIENPATSRLWLLPELKKLEQQYRGLTSLADFCGYGTPWRKRTRFMYWNLPQMEFKRCSGMGICSYSHRKHIILQGKDPSGVFYTRRAQAYPVPMCDTLAADVLARR